MNLFFDYEMLEQWPILDWLETPFFSQTGISGHMPRDFYLVRHSSYTQNGDAAVSKSLHLYVH